MKPKVLFAFLLLLVGLTGVASQASAQSVRPGDTFDLKLSGVPSDDSSGISGTYTVDRDGYVNISLLNKLKVAGKESGEIQSMIESAYRNAQIFTHPTIVLTFQSGAGRGFVNVSGAVKSPQRVTYTPDMTVMSAINAAGDFNDYANQKGVRLTHGGTVKIVNCKEVRRNPALDDKVQPGDSIMVPESIF